MSDISAPNSNPPKKRMLVPLHQNYVSLTAILTLGGMGMLMIIRGGELTSIGGIVAGISAAITAHQAMKAATVASGGS